jgi:hypothetical protein
MLTDQEAHRQHVLTMIETAQRAGRSEREIAAIVDRFCDVERPRKRETDSNHLFTRLRALIAA